MNVFEQVNDMVVLDLDISGFEDLSEKQKKHKNIMPFSLL